MKTLRTLIILLLVTFTFSQVYYPYVCRPRDRFVRMCPLYYVGVCGHFGPNVQCFRAPCGVTSSNICTACRSWNVRYVTLGTCEGGIISRPVRIFRPVFLRPVVRVIPIVHFPHHGHHGIGGSGHGGTGHGRPGEGGSGHGGPGSH
jgi:hypothetical protein